MANESGVDYAVGYRRPPRQTRFRKGASGNPNGRPRGARNLATLLDQTLRERIAITENGKRRKVTKLAAALKQLVNRALAGDLRAMRLLLDRVQVLESRAHPGAPEDAAALEQADHELIRDLRARRQGASNTGQENE
jgi:Family of unknown function (DUF5681)